MSLIFLFLDHSWTFSFLTSISVSLDFFFSSLIWCSRSDWILFFSFFSLSITLLFAMTTSFSLASFYSWISVFWFSSSISSFDMNLPFPFCKSEAEARDFYRWTSLAVISLITLSFSFTLFSSFFFYSLSTRISSFLCEIVSWYLFECSISSM